MTDVPTERPRWQRVLLNWVLPAIGLVAVVQLVGAWRAPSLPDIAPDFALASLDGDIVSLAELRGQTVVVNFWATWCGPCRVEIPSFSSFAKNNPDIAVVGIVADGPPAKVAQVSGDLGITYPVLLADRETLAAYGISSFPTTFVIDGEGRVVRGHVGVMLRPQLWWATRGL